MKTIKFLNSRPKLKEWAWFITLWCFGLFSAFAIAYPIKWMIKLLG